MQEYRFRCSSCEHELEMEGTSLGKVIYCPTCQTPASLPELDESFPYFVIGPSAILCQRCESSQVPPMTRPKMIAIFGAPRFVLNHKKFPRICLHCGNAWESSLSVFEIKVMVVLAAFWGLICLSLVALSGVLCVTTARDRNSALFFYGIIGVMIEPFFVWFAYSCFRKHLNLLKESQHC